jgi:hypothetical protein
MQLRDVFMKCVCGTETKEVKTEMELFDEEIVLKM